MANCCITEVAFYGKPENIRKLNDLLNRAHEVQKKSKPFKNVRHLLLASVSVLLGYQIDGHIYDRDIDKIVVGNDFRPESPQCNRSSIPDCELKLEDELLTFFMKSEWEPPTKMLETIAKEFNLELEYMAIEAECGVYEVYGPGKIFTKNYYINRYDDSGAYETEDEVFNELIKHLNSFPCLKPYVSSVEKIRKLGVESPFFKDIIDRIRDYAYDYGVEEAIFYACNMRN